MRDWETRTFARKPLKHAALDKLNSVRLPAERLYEGIVLAETHRKQRFFESVDVRRPAEAPGRMRFASHALGAHHRARID